MKKGFYLCILLLVDIHALAEVDHINQYNWKSFNWITDDADPYHNNIVRDFVMLSANVRVDIELNKSEHGFGFLALCNQKFFIIIDSLDAASFRDSILDTQFIDMNGDGFKDLIFSGMVKYSGEKDAEIYEREDVVFIYLYDPDTKRFKLKYKKASFDLEVAGDAEDQWWKRYHTLDKYKKFRERDSEKGKGIRPMQMYVEELAP